MTSLTQFYRQLNVPYFFIFLTCRNIVFMWCNRYNVLCPIKIRPRLLSVCLNNVTQGIFLQWSYPMTRDTHTYCRAVTVCFLRFLFVAAGILTPNLPYAGWTLLPTAPLPILQMVWDYQKAFFLKSHICSLLEKISIQINNTVYYVQ